MSTKAEVLARSTKFGSSVVMVMISSINPSIEASFALVSTSSSYAWTSGSCNGWYYSSLISCLWGDWSSIAYHNLSLRRSFTRSIVSLLTVVYSAGMAVIMKIKWRNSRSIFYTMAIHVDGIYAFAWMWWYAAPISALPIKIIFDGYLICMSVFMLSIISRENS